MRASVSVILSLKAERPKTKHQRLTSRKTAERSKEGDKGARKGTNNTGYWTNTQLFPCIPNRCIRTVYTAFAMHSVRMQLISLYRICYASINLLRASIMSSWFALFISLFENSNSLSLVTHTLSLSLSLKAAARPSWNQRNKQVTKDHKSKPMIVVESKET